LGIFFVGGTAPGDCSIQISTESLGKFEVGNGGTNGRAKKPLMKFVAQCVWDKKKRLVENPRKLKRGGEKKDARGQGAKAGKLYLTKKKKGGGLLEKKK